jgi:hypothetical protein
MAYKTHNILAARSAIPLLVVFSAVVQPKTGELASQQSTGMRLQVMRASVWIVGDLHSILQDRNSLVHRERLVGGVLHVLLSWRWLWKDCGKTTAE